MSALADRLSGWMRQRVLSAGASGLVFGLSGGVDSAVVGRLCQLATPGEVLAVILPCHSDPQDEHDALRVARHFDLPVRRVDLDRSYELLIDALKSSANSMPVSAGARPSRTSNPGCG